jgi:hypothetical protein
VVVAAELQEAEGLLARQECDDHGHDGAHGRADVRWKTNSFFKRDYLEVQKINRCSIYVDMHVLL